jgi:hypothetical protein
MGEDLEWAQVFSSRDAQPILDFLNRNPEFDVNTIAPFGSIPCMSPTKALFLRCDSDGLLRVLEMMIKRGLCLTQEKECADPLRHACIKGNFAAALMLVNASAHVAVSTLINVCTVHRRGILELVLWRGLPPVSHVEKCYEKLTGYPRVPYECYTQLSEYTEACRRRSATLAATLWFTTSYTPAIWRDLAEPIVARIADIPLEEF